MRLITPISDPVIEQKVGPRGRFTLRVASSEVSVRGVEGDTVRVGVDNQQAFARAFSVESGEGFLEIRQNEKLGFNLFGRGESVDFEVEVPHGATVRIDSQSGEVEANDLSGAKSFRSASGEVALHRLAGPTEVETVSGDVELEGGAPIDLKIKTVSGDIEVRLPQLRRLDMGTTSGDMHIDAELKGDGPFAIRTISGDVLVVGRGGFRVQAETITGDLTSDVPSRIETASGRRTLTVGRPGPTLSFRSVSGDFHVAEPRQAAPKLQEAAMTSDDSALESATLDSSGSAGDPEAKRLEILRQLERGEISVAEAGDRLGELDEVLR
jgi:DUF4097 and DUF4098 domain-containing protein YvlB